MITIEKLKDNKKDIEATSNILSNFYFISSTEIKLGLKRTLVARDSETKKIIGAVQLASKLNKVNLLVVDKKWRRQGIGKLLFDKLIEEFKLTKLICLATLWPGNSTPFWMAMGFKPTGKIEQTKKGNWMLELFWEIKK